MEPAARLPSRVIAPGQPHRETGLRAVYMHTHRDVPEQQLEVAVDLGQLVVTQKELPHAVEATHGLREPRHPRAAQVQFAAGLLLLLMLPRVRRRRGALARRLQRHAEMPMPASVSAWRNAWTGLATRLAWILRVLTDSALA